MRWQPSHSDCDTRIVRLRRWRGQLARVWRGKRAAGKLFLHTSGALDRCVLAPLARMGAATGSLHPMQTFSGKRVPKLKGIVFAIEGDPRARQAARAIARSLGGVPIDDQRARTSLLITRPARWPRGTRWHWSNPQRKF